MDEVVEARVYDDLRPPAEPGVEYRRAGVLILLYPRGGEEHIVFMRRTETVEHHKGQISLPGGGEDPDDESIEGTALREAWEELGIDPRMVEIMGAMPDVYARVSSFVITPVVGRLYPEASLDGLAFKPAPDEVAEVIEVPLSVLRDEKNHRVEQRAYQGVIYNVHYYTYGPYEIWGATGRIMYEFLKTFES